MDSDRQQQSPDDKFWTAKEWAERTRVPYRTILAAAARGELLALRPSGTARGVVLISESSWTAWLNRSQLRVRVSSRVEPDAVDLSALAIGRR